MTRWFLQMVGLEVTVLGRVGIDVIFAAPLPKLEQPAPAGMLDVNEWLGNRLSRVDGLLWFMFTGSRSRSADGRWKS